MKLTPYQVKELRTLLRTACIARDCRCIRCGHSLYIETSHILPKGTHRALQYDLQNVIMLCGNGSPNNCHHNFWHKYPQNSKTWFDRKYPERAEYLQSMRLKHLKMPPFEDIKKELLSAIDYYNNKNYVFTASSK